MPSNDGTPTPIDVHIDFSYMMRVQGSKPEDTTMGTDILSALGFDPEDPDVIAATHDAETRARIVHELHQHRVGQHMNQTEAAQRMGSTQSVISNLERVGGDPRLSSLQRYARAVNFQLHVTLVPWTVGESTASGEVIPLRGRTMPSEESEPFFNEFTFEQAADHG